MIDFVDTQYLDIKDIYYSGR